MENAVATPQTASVITPTELLEHWQGHRSLTRRVIEAFPEKELFEYSIGGMRPFAAMAQELLAIAAPGMKQVATGQIEELNEEIEEATTKERILALWDQSTEEINTYWAQVPEERFRERILTFGKYDNVVWCTILYFIDNEIHHRGQGYVYLRALGIEPPAFWNR